MFIKIFTAGPVATNAALVACSETKKAAVVDAPQGSLALIQKEADKQGFTVEWLLLTHTHWDHIVDAAAFKKMFSLKIAVHPADRGNLEDPGSDGLPLFFPIEGVVPDRFLSDQETIRIGHLNFTVIHTPGHTPGGVCFWSEKENILLSGDTLFRGTIGNLSFPTARPKEMWSSLKKLASLPLQTRVFPGHGEATTIGAESWLMNAEALFGEDDE